MRIGIFTDTYEPEINGVATSCKTLHDTLVSYGHEVFVFTTGSKNSYDEKTKLYRIKGITIKSLYGYKLVIPFNKKVIDEVKKLQLDLIHCNTEYGVGLLGFKAAKKLGIPLVYTFHTMYEYYTYYITHGFLDGLFKKLVRHLLVKYTKKANEVIVPSLETKEYLESIKCKKLINVVPTGIDFSYLINYKIDEEKLLSIRKTLQIPSDFKIFLCLGRIAKEKNFDETIHYFDEYIKKTNLKAKLILVGDGPYLNELKKRVKKEKEEDNVIFLGRVNHDDVALYYKMADLYLNSSVSETQGLTYIEAIACNCLILVKYAPYLKGVVEDKVSGFTYLTQDEFNEKLNSFINLDKIELMTMKNRALNNIEKFSIENFYKNIMRVYNRAIKDRY